METRTEVKTFLVNEKCHPEKGCTSVHKATGIILNKEFNKYQHVCECCQEYFYYDKKYPKIEYEEIE